MLINVTNIQVRNAPEKRIMLTYDFLFGDRNEEAWKEQDRGCARVRNPARLMTIDTEGGGQGEYL